MTPEVCPNCGADVPPSAKACPECGACEETGWSEEAAASHLGIPDENFDYEDFTKREFGSEKPMPRGVTWFWWIVGLVLLIVLVLLFLRGR